VRDHEVIKIFTTKVSVTIGGFDFEDTLLNLQNRDIKGTTTQIVDSNNLVTFLVKTKCKGSGGGLVDDTEHIQSRNFTSVFGGLTLGVVEISRDSDN
jgi:hypothetical protein